jgi:hypothetical protein
MVGAVRILASFGQGGAKYEGGVPNAGLLLTGKLQKWRELSEHRSPSDKQVPKMVKAADHRSGSE